MLFKTISFRLSKKDQNQINKERALLLWRVILRHPQYDRAIVKSLNKEVITRIFINHPEKYLSPRAFELAGTLEHLFKMNAANEKTLQTFAAQVAAAYVKEIHYLQGQREKVAFDIIFQILDLVKINKSPQETREVLAHMGVGQADSQITADDRAMFVKLSPAYLKMSHMIDTILKTHPKFSVLNENRDKIITKVASLCPEVTLTALDSMFRRLVAQKIMIVKGASCTSIVLNFIQDYGLGLEQKRKIEKYIPEEAPLSQFYAYYLRAVRTLKHVSTKIDNPFESDIGLLRFLLNYLNAQVTNLSEKIPA